MEVRVFSDVHLEFGPFDPGEGDVLVLAGDICTAEDIFTQGEKSLGNRYRTFFRKCADNYNKVYYVLGNHESYSAHIDRSVHTIRDHIDDRVHILDNTLHQYKGVTFVGGTLWTDMGGGHPAIMMQAQNKMNDYNLIYKGSDTLTPQDTLQIHRETMTWLQDVLDGSERVFMITHHAPSVRSLDERSKYMAEAYCSDLEEFIWEHPQIKWWAHGHIHKTNDYMLGQCRVLSNPRGYYNNGENRKFNREMSVTV